MCVYVYIYICLCIYRGPSLIEYLIVAFQLLLLKVGGEQIYAGPLGCLSSNLIKYFEVSLIKK
jgi:hypothetical protein